MSKLRVLLAAVLLSVAAHQADAATAEDIETVRHATRAILQVSTDIFGCGRTAELQIFYGGEVEIAEAGSILTYTDDPINASYIYFTEFPVVATFDVKNEMDEAEDAYALFKAMPSYAFKDRYGDKKICYVFFEGMAGSHLNGVNVEDTVLYVNKCCFIRELTPSDPGYSIYHEFDMVNDYDPDSDDRDSNLLYLFFKQMHDHYK